MVIQQRYWRYFDWISLLLTLILSSLGLAFVFSSTYRSDALYSVFFKKQLIGVLGGFIIYGAASLLDYRTFCRWGFYAFFGVIGLLIFTILKGSIGLGAQRWIDIGFFKIQPSELAKLFFPAFITYLIVGDAEAEQRFSYTLLGKIVTALALTCFLIKKQPDLGTTLIILITSFILLWLAGVSKRFFIIIFLGIFIAAPVAWYSMHSFQKKRVLVFLGYGDAHQERYQIEQSKIAIGSGSLFGKGFLQGTQNKLLFLPEGRTDFIFAVLCEELGLLGGTIILLLFSLLFSRLFYIIWTTKTLLARLLAIGVCTPLILSTMINISMVLGLLPVVGIPLPLLSYGICHTWITLASLGVLNSIAIRRFYH